MKTYRTRGRVGRAPMNALTLLAALIFSGGVFHAEIILSPEDREKQATHIVIGKVTGLLSQDAESDRYGKGTEETHYTIEIAVEIVVKATGYPNSRKLKREIRALSWRIKKLGERSDVPGPGGHFVIPKTDDRVCAFLIAKPTAPEGEFDVVYPTGLELICNPNQ